MALANKDWGPLLLSTTPATLVDGSTTLDTVVTKFTVTNIDASTTVAFTFTKQTGTSNTSGKEVVFSLPVPPGCTVVLSGPFTIKAAAGPINFNFGAITTVNKLVANASGYTV